MVVGNFFLTTSCLTFISAALKLLFCVFPTWRWRTNPAFEPDRVSHLAEEVARPSCTRGKYLSPKWKSLVRQNCLKNWDSDEVKRMIDTYRASILEEFNLFKNCSCTSHFLFIVTVDGDDDVWGVGFFFARTNFYRSACLWLKLFDETSSCPDDFSDVAVRNEKGKGDAFKRLRLTLVIACESSN